MVGIGTWNLENLYRPGGQFGPRTEAAYDAKLTTLANTITRLAPDVLAVQEVGQPEALADLVDRLGGTWSSVLSAHPDARGIRVGFLTRYAPTQIVEVVKFPAGLAPIQVGDGDDVTAQMGRGGLHATFDVDGVAWDVITLHLKSKLLTFPGGKFAPTDEDQRARYGAYALFRRAAEATTLRAYADSLLVSAAGDPRRVVMLGDANDTDQAATTQILYGPPGSQYGTGGFIHPDKGDATRLWTLAPKIPAEHHYSRINQGQHELIDHILISHALLADLQSVDADVSGLTSIGTDPTTRRDTPASDHAPVVAQFGDS